MDYQLAETAEALVHMHKNGVAHGSGKSSVLSLYSVSDELTYQSEA